MTRFAPNALLTAALSAVALSAQAAPNLFEGQATISEMSIEVIDLRPDDGVIAAFLPGKHTLAGSTHTNLEPYLDPWEGLIDAGHPVASTTTQQALKQVIGGPDFQFRLPDAQTGFGRLSGDYTATVAVQGAELLGDPLMIGFDAGMSVRTQSWVLKPGTEVRISGVFDLSMRNDLTQVTPDLLPDNDWFVPYQYADVGAHMTFSVVGGDPAGVFVGPSTASARLHTDVLEITQQIDQSQSDHFVLVARNLGTTDVVLNSDFGVNARFLASTPIPEPSSVALVFAGLGLMGSRLRRKA